MLRLLGLRRHAMPFDGERVASRSTVPVNPWSPFNEIWAVPVDDARTVTLAPGELTVKSWTVYSTNEECADAPGLVAVRVTLYTPAVSPEQERLLVPEVPSTMLLDDNVHVNPVEGEIDATIVTMPVNPLSELTVTVDDLPTPARAVREIGLAEME